MKRCEIDPARHVRPQVQELGLTEPLAHPLTVLYRFYDATGVLLYVGVTRRPFDRWPSHRRTAAWWPEVHALSVEIYPHEREALDAEVKAIRSEIPLHNLRSAGSSLTDSSCAAHEESRSYSSVVLPRVGGGVGGGVRGGFVGHPCVKSHQGEPRRMGGRSAAEIGGV